MSEREIVIFRKWRDGGEVIALFPCEPTEILNRYCSCYQHIGQHGEADLPLVIARTVPATPREYRELAKELRRIGYKLDIRKRSPGIGYLKRERARRNMEMCRAMEKGKL